MDRDPPPVAAGSLSRPAPPRGPVHDGDVPAPRSGTRVTGRHVGSADLQTVAPVTLTPTGDAPVSSAPSTATLGHQPALDGIRGLAVAAVLAFHGGVLAGGFLGVDAFFVLSGFLITMLLVEEHGRLGRIRLGAFWARRVRRLLPALLLVVTATVLVYRTLLPPEEVALLRTDALATLGYVANWRMLDRGTGCAATACTSPRPASHAGSPRGCCRR